MPALYALMMGVLMLIAYAICNGYVLMVLWGWFIVPTFHLPVLTITTAIGLAMVVSYVTYYPNTSDNGNTGRTESGMNNLGLLKPLFALMFGAVVHHYM